MYLSYSWTGSFGTTSGATAIVSLPLGTHIIALTVIDSMGDTDSDSLQVTVVDTAPPAISAFLSSPPNTLGWHDIDVTISFACSDTGSGIAVCPNPVNITKEDANQIVAGTATDNVGNSASTSVTINLDKTPPILIMPTLDPTYLYNALANFNFSAQDTLSGLVSYYATLNGVPISSGTTTTLTNSVNSRRGCKA